MLRVVLIIITVAIVFVGLPAAGFGAYFLRYYAPIPPAEFPEPANELEARQQDLDYLRRLTEFDRSFSNTEQRRFNAHIDNLYENAETLTDAEFAMGVAAAAAITENGHTNVRLRDLVGGLNSLPLRFYWFGDGLHIVRARDSHANLVGARVVSYEATPPEALVARLDPYFGGNYEFLQFQSPVFLASPAAMHAAGLARDPNQIMLQVETVDGSVRDVIVERESTPTPAMRVEAHVIPEPSSIETDSPNEWVFLGTTGSATPHYIKHPDTDFWWEALPNGGVYLRLKWILDADDISISDWLKQRATELKASPADYLVLDLRSNGGGDMTQSMNFARTITDLVTPDGHIYILTDGGTFSAAIVTAAYALHSAGDQGTVVGVHVGDDEQFWAEGGGLMTLPNSGLRLSIATGYHDWENGCSDWSRCYWMAAALGVAAGPLDPDINAPLTYADFIQGVDSGVAAILEAEGIDPSETYP